MASNTETGHAINVANFQDIIAFCVGYGRTYDPPKAALKLTALNAQLANAKGTLADVMSSKNVYDTAVGDRQLLFEKLKPLATKIVNFLSATDASEKTIEDAKAINYKIQGKRATKPKGANEPGDGTQPRTVSASRQSYDMMVENFAALIDLVSSIPSYTPNEEELTLDALNAYLDKLNGANTNVINTDVDYSNARISRNAALYAPGTGVTDTVADIKKYIKAIFGAKSPQYKQVSKIKFTNRTT